MRKGFQTVVLVLDSSANILIHFTKVETVVVYVLYTKYMKSIRNKESFIPPVSMFHIKYLNKLRQLRRNLVLRLVKLKLFLCFSLTEHHAMKAYWGSGGIAPRIL